MTASHRARVTLLGLGAVSLCAAALVAPAIGASGELIGPLEYLCEDDSPFNLEGFYLEVFEDGTLDVPGAVPSTGGVVGPGGAADSVDCDDGVIDGSGTNGRSWFSPAGATGIRFQFCEGHLPTHAGIVWTDGEGAEVTFEAFDEKGFSLGVLLGHHIGQGVTGQTDEDRFYGVIHEGGVSAIHIRNPAGGIEVDHLQYGPRDRICLDFSRDCVVGFEDLLNLLSHWGPCKDCPQDLDGSGDVDFEDIITILARWGPCSS